jgi:ABC-type uncharacterized transport system involved in gliding motility auxiliary subunit
MRITRKSRLRFLAENLAFTLLFLAALGLAAWLSRQYAFQADWSYGQRNSLSAASAGLLKTLDKPLTFTAYARDERDLREYIKNVIGRYQKLKPDITLGYVNPDTEPQAARTAGITADGQVIVTYGGRSETLSQLDEDAVSNAIQRLARSAERFVVFLSGDGERDPLGEHNFDLGDFGRQLQTKGFKVQSLNLAATPVVPQNTSVLVIAGPQAALLPGTAKLVRDYLQRGGNLLWLSDPGPLYGLEPLTEDLGIHFGAGTIVDLESQLFGINDPTVVVVPSYDTTQAITKDFKTTTAYAAATDVEAGKGSGWKAEAFLQTLPRSWLETGKLQGQAVYDPKHGDKLGPLPLGVSLTRPVPGATGTAPAEQRVAVIGDGDFLSNAYLGSGGNLDLGLNIFNWLAHDDRYINIDARPAPDLTLNLTAFAQAVIGFGFLLVLPVIFLVAGVTVWIRRRRR